MKEVWSVYSLHLTSRSNALNYADEHLPEFNENGPIRCGYPECKASEIIAHGYRDYTAIRISNTISGFEFLESRSRSQ
jgi:hypothetical protein